MTTRSPQPSIPPPQNRPLATLLSARTNRAAHPTPNCKQTSRPMPLRFAPLNFHILSRLAKSRKSFCAEFSLVPTSRTHVLSLRFPLIKPTAHPWPHPALSRRAKLRPVLLKNSGVCARLIREVCSAMQAAAQQECPQIEFPVHTPCLDPVSAISNRYNKLIEFLVTYTKQKVALISNRHKMPLVAQPAFDQIPRNAPLAVAVKTRGDWNPRARAVTIQTQISLETAI